jgi:hypothetical protein
VSAGLPSSGSSPSSARSSSSPWLCHISNLAGVLTRPRFPADTESDLRGFRERRGGTRICDRLLLQSRSREHLRRLGRLVLRAGGNGSGSPGNGSGSPEGSSELQAKVCRRSLPDGEGAELPRRTLFWTIAGSVVAAAAVVAVVIALTLVNSGTPPKASSSPGPPVSASASSPADESAPVVIPETSSTSSFSYLADLKPSGNLGELVNPGPVKIAGSIYPKSILFSCNVGDPTAFPAYKLKHNARRFQATIGLGAKFPPHFEAGVILNGDGRTLRTFSVSGLKPKTVDVNVTGVHTLQLECFGSGQSSSAGWAVTVAWGNARVTERH